VDEEQKRAKKEKGLMEELVNRYGPTRENNCPRQTKKPNGMPISNAARGRISAWERDIKECNHLIQAEEMGEIGVTIVRSSAEEKR